MKKETIGFMLSMFLLFGGYFAVQNYYIKSQQVEIEQRSQVVLPKSSTSSAADAQQTDSAVLSAEQTSSVTHLKSQYTQAKPEELIVKRAYATFDFTSIGGCLGQNVLTGEIVSYTDPTPISVIENHNICKAYGFRIGNEDLRSKPAEIYKTPKGVLISQTSNGLEVLRSFEFSDDNKYLGELTITVKNNSQIQQNTNVDFELGATSDNKNSGGLFSSNLPQFHGISIRLSDGTVKRETSPFDEAPAQKLILSEHNAFPTWITADSLYWMNAVIPQNQTPIGFEYMRTAFNLRKDAMSEIDQTMYEAWVKQPVNLLPGQQTQFKYKVYIGPKNETILKHYDEFSLYETIDYGFFKIIARPLYHVLYFLQGLLSNWGIAIIVLTVFINIIFLPLQIKGYSSAQKMQKIQPQMKALQEKFKDDKQALQRETMALMSKSGVNPLSGCLPLLPQIPVFFGLDSCLRHTFDLRQSPFYFWIHDLTQPDPYFVLPVIMAALMIGYQKMMPMPSMDPTQAKMMKFLPIVFSVFMIFYPSGLALYVITNTVISMIRQAFLTRHYKKAQAK